VATVEYFIVGLAVDVCGASILLTPKQVGLFLLLLLYMTAGCGSGGDRSWKVETDVVKVESGNGCGKI